MRMIVEIIMKNLRPGLLTILFAIIWMATACSSGKGEDLLIREFNNQIHDLPGNQPLKYTDAVFNNLLSWESYSVIGLGEAAHGAKNFFELKSRLFQYLVENHSYRVLAYEFSFRTSLKINDYVLHGVGDLDSLFAGDLWVQDNYEVQDLIQWMHQYNSARLEKDKIYFVGIDNQLDAFYPEKTIDRINILYPEIVRLNQELVSDIISLEHINYEGIPREEYERRKGLFEKLMLGTKSYFQENPDLARSLNSKVAMHLTESLINSNQWLFNIFTGEANNRDLDLAQNVLWVKENYNSRVAVWAHNSHVQNNPSMYGEGAESMGYHLKKSLKEKYLIISTGFTNGKFIAVMDGPDGQDTAPLVCEISGEPPAESLNNIFSRAEHRNFFLNVEDIQAGSHLYSFLDTIRPMLGIGDWFEGSQEFHYSSSDRRINLLNATDALFYFSHTEPVTIHKRFYQ